MPVPMMNVRVMRMDMHQRLMTVWMRVRLSRWITRSVQVPMMLVVQMKMFVLEHLVNVFVLVTLHQMQPHAERHQCPA